MSSSPDRSTVYPTAGNTQQAASTPSHASTNGTPNQQLSLPAPTDESAATLDIGSSAQQKLALDHLGPMVVNTDGTLSRIHNWAEMTEAEKDKTMRVLSKRNRARTEALQQSQA